MRAMHLDLAKVARLVVSAFAQQIFQTGFVHSDPHPGNVLVRRAANGDPEVVVRWWWAGVRVRVRASVRAGRGCVDEGVGEGGAG